MTTASNAIKACIEGNWNVGSGGTEPTVYTGAEEGMYPSTAEWIFLKTWEYAKRRKRRNDSFVKEDDYVGLRVYTRNHANKEERLDEMVNEIYRIVTPTNVTGYHKVDIIDQHRRGTDKRQEMYVADLTVELKILSTSSSAVPGSTESGNDWSMDSLIFTDGGSKVDIIRDEDDMASDDENALITQQSAKAYIDAQIGAENELSEMNDVDLTGLNDDDVIVYDLATTTWKPEAPTGGEAFKTITGITNDVVADASDDTLTLTTADAKLTIVGTAATDTVTFSVIEGQIDHDALTNFVAAEHKLEAAIDHDALLNFLANKHIDHSGVTITAGTGLSGGGTIAANRTIDCDITQYTDALARTAVVEDAAFGSGWNADTTHAPSQNAVYDELAKINQMRSHATQMQIYNGAGFYNSNNFCCAYLPLNDNNAAISCRIAVPESWSGTTGTLSIMCALEHASNTFSWKINVKSLDDGGEVWPGTAIITQDDTHDITGTGTSLEIQIETVSLSGIAAGDVLMASVSSDALNSNNIYVMDLWLD